MRAFVATCFGLVFGVGLSAMLISADYSVGWTLGVGLTVFTIVYFTIYKVSKNK